MFSVVAVNLGDWFKLDSGIVMAAGKIDENETETDTKINEEVKAPEVKEENNVVEETPENKEEVIETPKAETPQGTPSTSVIVEIKRIVIPNGTPGVGIAKILQEKGLINSTGDFVRVAEELKLAVKLKSGTFEIPTNSSIEDMVRIIAGQK